MSSAIHDAENRARQSCSRILGINTEEIIKDTPKS